VTGPTGLSRSSRVAHHPLQRRITQWCVGLVVFRLDNISSLGGPMNERFDFIVIGSGPAGEKAATQAAYFGKHVGIVERSATPGGVPVSNAGIPTKTLRETALYITGFRKFGGSRRALQYRPLDPRSLPANGTIARIATGGDGIEKPAHRPMIVTPKGRGRENALYSSAPN
jgi:hypothetical protein